MTWAGYEWRYISMRNGAFGVKRRTLAFSLFAMDFSSGFESDHGFTFFS